MADYSQLSDAKKKEYWSDENHKKRMEGYARIFRKNQTMSEMDAADEAWFKDRAERQRGSDKKPIRPLQTRKIQMPDLTDVHDNDEIPF